MFVPKYTKRRKVKERPQTFCQTERPSSSLQCLSHDYMATGWVLSCRNIIRNVPESLCDPSYALLSLPLFALSCFLLPPSSSLLSFFWPILSDSRHSLGVSQGTRGVEEGFWAHCPAPAPALPSCSLRTDPHSERVRESDGKTYQNTCSRFHRVMIANAHNCSTLLGVILSTDI